MRLRAVLLFPLTIALVLLGAPLSAAPASPVAYPVQGSVCAFIEVSTTAPAPGEAIIVTGQHFDPHGHVTLVLARGDVLKHVTANAKGSFSTRVVTPSDVTGAYLIHARGGKTNQPSDCPADPALIPIRLALLGLFVIGVTYQVLKLRSVNRSEGRLERLTADYGHAA